MVMKLPSLRLQPQLDQHQLKSCRGPAFVRYLIFDVADAGLERYQPSQVYQSIVSAAKYFPQCICARRWQQSDGLA
jgi:hypothetical protein